MDLTTVTTTTWSPCEPVVKEEGCEASFDPQESFIHLGSDSFVASGPCKMTKDQILNEIKRYQDMCEICEGDCLSLKANTRANEQDLVKFQEEYELLSRNILEPENEGQEDSFQVPAALPEREMVFKGHVEEGKMENLPEILSFLPQIRYPILGGSALITFEDPEVARRIIQIRQHCVQLDELSYMHVKAEAMTLLLPSFLKQISLKQSSQQVLLSGLSAFSLSKDQLYDKLILFFSKRKNLGGEVDHLEQLPNSDNVVLTFVDDGVAERIVKKGLFQVLLGKETHQVKASHCLHGEIADLQLHPSICPRTVLLTEIPDVLEREMMCEALEIHFQKQSKGGGEVETAVYIPAGHYAVAVFEEED